MSDPLEQYGSWDEETIVVPVGAAADYTAAGQRLADESGCIYAYDGQHNLDLQECECAPTHDADGGDNPETGFCGDHAGTACVVRKDVPCWVFVEFGDDSDDTAEEAAEYGEPVFRPRRASPEAPSMEMFGVEANA